jgi:hypothetical protein
VISAPAAGRREAGHRRPVLLEGVAARTERQFAAAVLTQLALRRLRARAAIQLGLAVLIPGLALLAASLDVASYPLFLAYVGITIPVIGAGIVVAETSILTSFIIVGSVLAAFDLAALTYLRRHRD